MVAVGAGMAVSVAAGMAVSVGAGIAVSVGAGMAVLVGAGMAVSAGAVVGAGVAAGAQAASSIEAINATKRTERVMLNFDIGCLLLDCEIDIWGCPHRQHLSYYRMSRKASAGGLSRREIFAGD
jgi:hypothetical protein